MTATTSESRSRDPEFAQEALRILTRSEIPFAVLHGEGGIASGSFTSDVDLACDVEFSVLIEQIGGHFQAAGIRPILAWPYDTGSTTLFVSNADATRGAQLDFLCDRTGRGKYGLDVRRLLSTVEMGTAFPRVSPVHELLYLARKRQVKEQWEECRPVLDQLSGHPEAASEIDDVFVGSVRDEVRKLLAGTLSPPRWRLRRASAEASRTVSRIRRPAGAWVEVIGSVGADTQARAIANRLGGLLPHVGWGGRPGSAPLQLQWLAKEVAPVRWRAGIYASWSDQERRPTAGLQLSAGEDLDSSVRRLVDWLEQRLLP